MQTHLSIDVISLEGKNFIHALDRYTCWSQFSQLSRRALEEQVRIMKLFQLYPHGVPSTILSYKKYNKGMFRDLCVENDIQPKDTPSHSDECNGLINVQIGSSVRITAVFVH